MLGDGFIKNAGNLNFSQSIKQKEYIEHCYNLFKKYTKTGIKLNLNKRKDKIYEVLYFDTCALFKNYVSIFYNYNENLKNV